MSAQFQQGCSGLPDVEYSDKIAVGGECCEEVRVVRRSC